MGTGVKTGPDIEKVNDPVVIFIRETKNLFPREHAPDPTRAYKRLALPAVVSINSWKIGAPPPPPAVNSWIRHCVRSMFEIVFSEIQVNVEYYTQGFWPADADGFVFWPRIKHGKLFIIFSRWRSDSIRIHSWTYILPIERNWKLSLVRLFPAGPVGSDDKYK